MKSLALCALIVALVFLSNTRILATPGTCDPGDCPSPQQCCDANNQKWCCPETSTCEDTNQGCGLLSLKSVKGNADVLGKLNSYPVPGCSGNACGDAHVDYVSEQRAYVVSNHGNRKVVVNVVWLAVGEVPETFHLAPHQSAARGNSGIKNSWQANYE